MFVAGDECINGWLDPICLANIGDQMGAEMEGIVESGEGVVAGSVVEISGIGDWVGNETPCRKVRLLVKSDIDRSALFHA